MNANFTKWLDTFIDEKGIDPEKMMEVEGPSGTNFIPVGCILEIMKEQSPAPEQAKIKDTIVKIDFHNGDVLHFFRHLAAAVAR